MVRLVIDLITLWLGEIWGEKVGSRRVIDGHNVDDPEI
jgi:hypothetical protein